MKMSGCKRQPQRGRPSIAYRCKKVEGVSFDLAEVVTDQNASTTSKKKKQSGINAEKYPQILSTTGLISAVGQIWNHVNLLPISGSKEKSDHCGGGSQKNVILGGPTGPDVGVGALKDDGSYFCVDVGSDVNCTPLVQSKFEFLKVTQKVAMFGPYCENLPSLPQFLKGSTKFSNEYWKQKGLASLAISYEWGKIYGWTNQRIPAESHNLVAVSELQQKKSNKICTAGCITSLAEGSISKDATDPGKNFSMRSVDFNSETVKSKDASFCDDANVAVKAEQASSLCSDYFLGVLHDNNVNGCVSWAPNCSLSADCHIGFLAPYKSTHESLQHSIEDDNLAQNTRKKPRKIVSECKNMTEIHSSACERPHHAVAKQEHAYAGAFAGIFVSLCLHPVDTVKTVTQSYRAEQKSTFDIGRSIVSERGITGLYRGISSNIASSAPVSAIYTFTYESVKGILLPCFSKEYHSLCHCIAGGSASIATSFVFTPSECVKQQMQIGSCYHNCWSALIGIIKKGGLPSLYAGWGAVLCRNVPHSIIKFYTYENLKQLMAFGKSTGQPSTLQTLACGGLSGSTAALFTTPFDVVKTRLQTQLHTEFLPSHVHGAVKLSSVFLENLVKMYNESFGAFSFARKCYQYNSRYLLCDKDEICHVAVFPLDKKFPGSMRQYDSVFRALLEIGKTEGLKGLYRGLIPRLVIYMSQGALFFASYEFLKRLFSLEVQQFNSQRIQYKETMEDDPKQLQLP